MWSPSEPSPRAEPEAPALGQLRAQIDRLDAELLERFADRLELARQIGACKRAEGRGVTDDAREREVQAAALERLRGRCPPASVAELVSALIRAARRVQEQPRVAYLGPATTHSHRAVGHWFADARLHPTASLADAIAAVTAGEADYAVVPWENRHAGPIVEVQAAIASREGVGLRRVDEAELPVHHVLAARISPDPGVDIERVYCRPEPLAAARPRLPPDLARASFVHVASNDAAARAAASCPRSAAITTEAAAAAAGLTVLATAIDGDANWTRFVVLARG